MARPAWPPPITSTSSSEPAGPGLIGPASVAGHVEAEHHAALVVFGDVAVRHPQPGVGDVQQDVDGLARAQQHGVLPHEIGFRPPVPGQDEEAAGSVDVERVVHRVVGVHLVDQADLHPVTHGERPGDLPVLGPGLPVDELPDHVAGVRCPVDLRHQVFPLEAVAVVVRCAPRPGQAPSAGAGGASRRHQLHPALRAGPGLGAVTSGCIGQA